MLVIVGSISIFLLLGHLSLSGFSASTDLRKHNTDEKKVLTIFTTVLEANVGIRIDSYV